MVDVSWLRKKAEECTVTAIQFATLARPLIPWVITAENRWAKWNEAWWGIQAMKYRYMADEIEAKAKEA